MLAGASSSREGTLCCQAVFTLLDTLQKWHGDAKATGQKEAQLAVRQDPGAWEAHTCTCWLPMHTAHVCVPSACTLRPLPPTAARRVHDPLLQAAPAASRGSTWRWVCSGTAFETCWRQCPSSCWRRQPRRCGVRLQWIGLPHALPSLPIRIRDTPALCLGALQCGAHARSLQYFETHVRTRHNGALNPAAYRSATYDDAEVSYLQARWARCAAAAPQSAAALVWPAGGR